MTLPLERPTGRADHGKLVIQLRIKPVDTAIPNKPLGHIFVLLCSPARLSLWTIRGTLVMVRPSIAASTENLTTWPPLLYQLLVALALHQPSFVPIGTRQSCKFYTHKIG